MIPLCGFVIITWINGFLDLKKNKLPVQFYKCSAIFCGTKENVNWKKNICGFCKALYNKGSLLSWEISLNTIKKRQEKVQT